MPLADSMAPISQRLSVGMGLAGLVYLETVFVERGANRRAIVTQWMISWRSRQRQQQRISANGLIAISALNQVAFIALKHMRAIVWRVLSDDAVMYA